MRCTDIAVILTTALLFHGQGFLPSREELLDPAEPGLSPRVARGNRHLYLDASDRHERSDSSQGSLGIFLRRKIPMDGIILEAQLRSAFLVGLCRPWRLISTPLMSMAHHFFNNQTSHGLSTDVSRSLGWELCTLVRSPGPRSLLVVDS
ncbi:uncharacterized protein BDV14DRAFT_79602 [Aspergillus stella-maris]|uniref:uncharacterized protein n=1 Tax=Aspergillus stella-maris TaxID=1810926 RepID=UPI003CCE0A90